MIRDHLDQIAELSEEVIERNAKLAETEVLVHKAREETSEGLAAKLNAQEELKRMNVEYRKIHKKCNEQSKISSEREAEIKRLNSELGKLRNKKLKKPQKMKDRRKQQLEAF